MPLRPQRRRRSGNRHERSRRPRRTAPASVWLRPFQSFVQVYSIRFLSVPTSRNPAMWMQLPLDAEGACVQRAAHMASMHMLMGTSMDVGQHLTSTADDILNMKSHR